MNLNVEGISMTIHKHERGVRLGIMGDAFIGPHHTVITKGFPRSIQNLAATIGVPQVLSRSPSPGYTNPTISPGLF